LIESEQCTDKKIRLWDVATGRMIFAAIGVFADPVLAATYAPERKTLIVTCKTYETKFGVTTLWNVDTGKSAATFKDSHRYSSAAFSPDGKTLAVGTSDEGKAVIKVWDLSKFNAGDK
jgi:WD40 repeat protein